ncbi:ARM repeat-containing protein [Polychaeton citri CBS 116435]|uniref:ARM repeat-containing protein n=1 Tax=Polychaeton citri CBS 116435 TaxID=1314669 RepID=A0A9P4UNY3_9PEZI|nr:ARM repeat-containing protein [Polychaeton citri CBS 116435]
MTWQPQEQPLSQLAQCLRDSISGNSGVQKNAEQMLKQAKQSPDINNYLVFLSANQQVDADQAARTAAAIMLKNHIRSSYGTWPDPIKEYLKLNILQGLQDKNTQIRSYVGNVITEVVRKGGILGWPQILPDIVTLVTSGSSQDIQDGAMGALFKICEDNKKALDKEYQAQRPLAFLLPKLLDFTTYSNAKVQARALAAINVFLNAPIALTAKENINQILSHFVQLSQNQNDDVRRHVCRAFALLADGMPDVLLPHVQGIVEYTLSQQSNSDNPELALDAAEFFFEASCQAQLRDALGPYLAQIVPVLLESMIYSEDDQLRLEGEAEDAELEDEAKDIKPQFATSKTSKGVTNEGTSTPQENGQSQSAVNGYAYEDDELSEGEIEEEDDEEANPEDEWNLRKCSAAALDSLSSHFHGPVFDVALPWMMENLQHSDWQNREAAVLALGAMGPGCMDVIKPHLPQLVPYMITLLDDKQPVVREITCWALSRFSSWAASLDSAGKQEFFEPIMDGILKRMLDNTKGVQKAAASAFATLEEAANKELTPYCAVIIQQFVRCFGKYKDKNMYILYDCVQTLAENAGPALAQPELVEILMPALIARWEKVQDSSREMFPLLECLAFVAIALGHSFAPFAKPFFMRCTKIIGQNLEDGMTAQQTSQYWDVPDKDFLVTSLDLLSSIIQALEEQATAELVASAQPSMFELLAYCMKDMSNDVRQSAYALLGDCAIYIFAQLQPYLPTILEMLISQLDISQAPEDEDAGFRVINNACWSLGEIAMRHQPTAMAPYTDRIMQKLAVIMFSENVPESLVENAATALGRLGIGCHQQLAPHLADFAVPFLKAMRNVTWTDEKGHALKGFVNVVLDNPQAMEKCLLDFFSEMASAPGVFLTSMQGDGPLSGFERALQTYKTMIGAGNFDGFLSNLPPPQEQALRQLYTF